MAAKGKGQAPVVVRAPETVVTVSQILAETGIGRATFYRWIEEGLLPAAIGRLQRRGQKGNPPLVWDISILAEINKLRRERVRLRE